MKLNKVFKLTVLTMSMVLTLNAQAQSAVGGLDWPEPKVLTPSQNVTTPALSSILADNVRAGSYAAGSAGGVLSIRGQAVQEAAASLGTRAGLARGLSDLDAALRKQTVAMDAGYNFAALALSVPMRAGQPATYPAPLTGNGEYAMILPSVVVEGRDVDSFPNDDEMRAADRVYKIHNKERLIPVDKTSGRPVVPDWRDYLVFSFQEVQMPHVSLMPKNDAEKAIWNEWVNKGWQEGLMQAQQLMNGGWARLDRDYKGMLNGRLAYSQGLLTRPQVAGVNMGVTGGGNEMRINDRTVRITDHSSLVPDTTRWSTKSPQ